MPYNTTNNVLSLHVLVQIVCYSNVDIQFSITGLFLLFFLLHAPTMCLGKHRTATPVASVPGVEIVRLF